MESVFAWKIIVLFCLRWERKIEIKIKFMIWLFSYFGHRILYTCLVVGFSLGIYSIFFIVVIVLHKRLYFLLLFSVIFHETDIVNWWYCIAIWNGSFVFLICLPLSYTHTHTHVHMLIPRGSRNVWYFAHTISHVMASQVPWSRMDASIQIILCAKVNAIWNEINTRQMK